MLVAVSAVDRFNTESARDMIRKDTLIRLQINVLVYGHENEMYNVGLNLKEGEKSVNEGVTCGLGEGGR